MNHLAGYFDYAAATPIDPRVVRAMRDYEDSAFANPASLHTRGRQAREQLEHARAQISQAIGAKPREIILTSGSTEAASIAIQGAVGAQLDARVAVSAIEHEAVLQAAASAVGASNVDSIPVSSDGIVELEALRHGISDETALACIQYVNNEIGSIQSIAKISALIAEIRRDRQQRGVARSLNLYCDAAQAGLLTLQVSRLGVDLMSMGGSKLYGPAGSGFLYVRTGTQLQPILPGGGQEQGLRGGTQHVAAAIGLASALQLVQAAREPESERIMKLRDELWRQIQGAFPDAILNGSMRHRHVGNLNVSFPGCDGETLVAHLDAAGFALATGSACTAANQDPSHVLLAIGRSKAVAESSLRVTLGQFTTSADVAALVMSLQKTVNSVQTITKKQQNRLQ